MATNFAIQLHQLQHDAVIEMFELDATIVGDTVHRFHNGTNQLGAALVWQGNTYERFPVQVEGYAASATGALARPTLTVSNVRGLIGVLIRQYRGLKGSKLTRKRTLAKYLDAVNFPGGVNPSADPTTFYPDDVHYLDRQVRRDKEVVVYECANALDLDGLLLPRRQIQHNHCPWVRQYRGPDCGYTGPAVAKADDTPTAVLAQDKCGGRLSSCRLRQWPDKVLNFGGFPGVGLIRSV